MDLYLFDSSSRTDNAVGSNVDLYELARSKRALADDRSRFAKYSITLAILLSAALKIYGLIVYFSRIQLQIFLLLPDKKEPNGQKRNEVFSDFMTDFSFSELVSDFWDAKAYFAALIIVFGSAVIPLAKHLFMLLAWLLPVPMEWQSHRRAWLFFFDQTGRSALVDLFFQGYVICIFYTKVVNSTGGLGVEIMLSGMPVRGIFAAIASVFTGSFLSHYMLVVHDEQIMGELDRQVTIADGPKVASLLQRLYASSVSMMYKRCISFTMLVIIVLCAGTLTVLLAETYTIVSFQMEGIAGSVANSGWRDFTLISAARDMPNYSNEVTGTRVLALLHLALVLVVPICILLLVCVLWFMPIHLKPQRRILFVFPFWFSWCGLDVFFVTTMASYLEMHLIAKFMFEKKFQTLCTSIHKASGALCVDLDHDEGIGLYILAACTVLFFCLFALMMRLGSILLETATNTYDQIPILHFSPGWEQQTSDPLLSDSSIANEFVILNGTASSSTTVTPSASRSGSFTTFSS